MGRIIIFTGKGGVGKTSIAAAHALISAEEGKKTLLVSVDMAHNLGDLFAYSVGRNVTEIKKNLYALELDPDYIMHEEFPNVQKAVIDFVGASGANITLNGHFPLPGFENLFSLLKIKQLYESNAYDRILVDCAPTGETLSLLKFPELLSWYIEKFSPVGKIMLRVLNPISKLRYHVKLPDRKALGDLGQMHLDLINLQELLKNREICTIRLVCIPEKMVVEETKRNFMYLNLYRYQVDGVFINRILPEHMDNPFMEKWHSIQKQYIEELEKVFVHMPLSYIPWYPEEIRGSQAVEKLCEDLRSLSNLFDIRLQTDNEEYSLCENGYLFTLKLPGVIEDEVEVYMHNLDMNIRIGNFNRCIPLPNTLQRSQITSVQLEQGVLKIQFKIPEFPNTEEAH